MEGRVRYYHNEWKLVANIWMQFVRYVEPNVEEWRFEANGKEQTYQRHV